jgi:hypothetical protein
MVSELEETVCEPAVSASEGAQALRTRLADANKANELKRAEILSLFITTTPKGFLDFNEFESFQKAVCHSARRCATKAKSGV